MSDQSAPSGPDTTAPADTGTMPDAAQDATATAPDQPEQQAPQTDEYRQRLEQQLQQMAQSNQTLMERFDALQQRIPEPEPEQEWEPEPGDDGYDEWQAQQWLQQQIDEQVQQRIAPLQQQQQVQARDAAYNDLTGRYPELQNPEVAQDIVARAADYADRFGLDKSNPDFVSLVEMTYKAHVADQRAQQETPAGTRPEVQLESAAGAAPADRDEDIQSQMTAPPTSANYLI
jgi:hypothetical protein